MIIAVAIPRFRPSKPVPAAWPQYAGGTFSADDARLGPIFPAVRGTVSAIGRRERSAFLGARVADYMTLGADSARAAVGADIAALLQGSAGTSIVASHFSENRTATMETVEAVEQFTDASLFRAAAWGELTRLHALAEDSLFVTSPEVTSAFTIISENRRLSSEVRAAAELMRSSFAVRPIPWAGIRASGIGFLGKVFESAR